MEVKGSSPRRRRGAARAVAARAAAWAALVALWLLVAGSFSLVELGVGSAAAAAAVALTVATARRAGFPHRLSASDVARAAAFAAPRIVTGSVAVLRVLIVHLATGHRPQGSIRRVALAGVSAEPDSAARRALAVLALTATPDTVVVDVEGDEPAFVIHELRRGAPDPSPWAERAGR